MRLGYWFRHILLASVILATPAGTGVPSSWADDGSCEVPEPPQEPAEGDWTGTFRMADETAPRAAITMKFVGKWEGMLEFKLLEGKIRGTATATHEITSFGTLGKLREAGDMATKKPMQLDVEGDGDVSSQRFKQVGLYGQPGNTMYTANFFVQDPEGKGSFSAELGGGKISGHGKGESRKGNYETDFSRSYDTLDKPRALMFPLQIKERSCGTMSGTADVAQILSNWKGGQYVDYVIKDSNWMAVIDGRDEAFEKTVEALAELPIPADPSPAYLETFNAAFGQLRGTGKLTDYKSCVLKSLDTKRTRINVALLRTLVNNYPKVRDGATKEKLSAAAEQILQTLQRFELVGLDQCPLAVKARKTCINEALELLRKLLSSKHTLRDLIQYRYMYNNGFLDADLNAQYERAFEAAAARASPKK